VVTEHGHFGNVPVHDFNQDIESSNTNYWAGEMASLFRINARFTVPVTQADGTVAEENPWSRFFDRPIRWCRLKNGEIHWWVHGSTDPSEQLAAELRLVGPQRMHHAMFTGTETRMGYMAVDGELTPAELMMMTAQIARRLHALVCAELLRKSEDDAAFKKAAKKAQSRLEKIEEHGKALEAIQNSLRAIATRFSNKEIRDIRKEIGELSQ